jgi:hypothetical protein
MMKSMRDFSRLLIILGALVIITSGCQTFTLSEADFQKQQRGQVADPEVGKVVGAAGSAAALAAEIGAAIAAGK